MLCHQVLYVCVNIVYAPVALGKPILMHLPVQVHQWPVGSLESAAKAPLGLGRVSARHVTLNVGRLEVAHIAHLGHILRCGMMHLPHVRVQAPEGVERPDAQRALELSVGVRHRPVGGDQQRGRLRVAAEAAGELQALAVRVSPREESKIGAP